MFAGDFAVGQTVDLKFTTRRFTTGAPFTLAGTPAVAAYPDNSVTQITAGITLSVDFDALTGLNNVRVVATAGNGYAAGTSYALVITAGTVDSVSVVGEVVGSFTLERGAAFGRLGAPAGASVSADVAAVKVDTAAILVDTGTTLDGRIPAALVGGRIDASVGAMAAGTVTAAAIATDAIDGDAIAASAVTEIQAGLSTLTAAQVNAEVDTALDTAIPAVNTAGSANDVLLDVVNARLLGTIAAGTHTAQSGDSFARLGAPVGASMSADVAGVQSDTDNIQTRLPAALVGGRMDSSVGADVLGLALSTQVDALEGDTTTLLGRLTAARAATLDNLPSAVQRNTALSDFPFTMVDSAGAPLTGLTVSATRRIDAGVFAAAANAPTEIADGWYTINLAAADLNGATIALRFTATGARDRNFTIVTRP